MDIGERAARAGRTRPARCPCKRLPRGSRRRRATLAVCSCTQRRLAELAGGPLLGPERGSHHGQFPDADADHVRELPGGAARRASHARTRAPGGDLGGARDSAVGSSADLPGRVRLPRLRPPGRPTWPRSLHACPRRSAQRLGLRIRRLALPALPLWTAVHARKLCDRAAGARRRVVGFEGARGLLEPRRGRTRRTSRSQAGSFAALGGGVRGPEPGAARAGRGRRTQRHADHLGARRRARTHRRGQPPLSRRRGRAGRRHRDQGHRRVGAAVPDARSARHAGAPGRGGERRAELVGARGRGANRLWLPRTRIPERGGRAAAAGGHTQRAG